VHEIRDLNNRPGIGGVIQNSSFLVYALIEIECIFDENDRLVWWNIVREVDSI
jgi:hypothetical protein